MITKPSNVGQKAVWLFGFVTLAGLNVAGLYTVTQHVAYGVWLAVLIGVLVALMASAMAGLAQRSGNLLHLALCAIAVVVAASLDGQAMVTAIRGGNATFAGGKASAEALQGQRDSLQARLEETQAAYLKTVGEAESMDNDGVKANDHLVAGLRAKAAEEAKAVETLRDRVQALEGEIVAAHSAAAGQGEKRFALLQFAEKQANPDLWLWGVCAGFWLVWEICVAVLAWDLGGSQPAPKAPARKRTTRRKATVKTEEIRLLIPAKGSDAPVVRREYGPRRPASK